MSELKIVDEVPASEQIEVDTSESAVKPKVDQTNEIPVENEVPDGVKAEGRVSDAALLKFSPGAALGAIGLTGLGAGLLTATIASHYLRRK